MSELLDLLNEWAALQPDYCWKRGTYLYLRGYHGTPRMIAGLQDINPDMVLGAILRAVKEAGLQYTLNSIPDGLTVCCLSIWRNYEGFEILGYEEYLEETRHIEPAIAALSAWISVLKSRQPA